MVRGARPGTRGKPPPGSAPDSPGRWPRTSCCQSAYSSGLLPAAQLVTCRGLKMHLRCFGTNPIPIPSPRVVQKPPKYWLNPGSPFFLNFVIFHCFFLFPKTNPASPGLEECCACKPMHGLMGGQHGAQGLLRRVPTSTAQLTCACPMDGAQPVIGRGRTNISCNAYLVRSINS